MKGNVFLPSFTSLSAGCSSRRSPFARLFHGLCSELSSNHYSNSILAPRILGLIVMSQPWSHARRTSTLCLCVSFIILCVKRPCVSFSVSHWLCLAFSSFLFSRLVSHRRRSSPCHELPLQSVSTLCQWVSLHGPTDSASLRLPLQLVHSMRHRTER
jgi:hypothetical protein